uniref:Uncharacterized protein n=1 Tax=Candidatus Kentrum sp. SD TaxID=2126332 RepID=A0A450YGP4_9GAMM|nr:MAG: hypothetical protein BECKSD772F_GA0070984_106611 [Candidatus Kentron sp. SD]VFK46135.1 MAG: hypothetical protein BECKSD772E_GA0070983_106711 [Candidatus Kentron sp. SD]
MLVPGSEFQWSGQPNGRIETRARQFGIGGMLKNAGSHCARYWYAVLFKVSKKQNFGNQLGCRRVDKRKRIHHHKRWVRFRLSTLHLRDEFTEFSIR